MYTRIYREVSREVGYDSERGWQLSEWQPSEGASSTEDITTRRAMGLIAKARQQAIADDRIDERYRITPRRVEEIDMALRSVGVDPVAIG